MSTSELNAQGASWPCLAQSSVPCSPALLATMRTRMHEPPDKLISQLPRPHAGAWSQSTPGRGTVISALFFRCLCENLCFDHEHSSTWNRRTMQRHQRPCLQMHFLLTMWQLRRQTNQACCKGTCFDGPTAMLEMRRQLNLENEKTAEPLSWPLTMTRGK